MVVKRLLYIYEMIQKGYNPSKIAKELGISKQAINRGIASLKANGYIQKVGYGTWQTTSKHLKSTPSVTSKHIRAHAFIWKVRFKKSINWRTLLHTKQINYDEVGVYNTPRIILNGQKIWLGSNNIVFYDKDSYYANTASKSIQLAISSLSESIKALEAYLDMPLGAYIFTCSRQHYSLIQNALAIQCDKEGKAINIKNEKGYWMTIDNSLNLHEAEAIHTETSPLDVEGIKKYFNSHKATKFQVTPEFVLNTMNGIQQNQVLFSDNIRTHIKAIQDLANNVNELTKLIKELKK